MDRAQLHNLAGLLADILVRWPLLTLTSIPRRKGWIR